MKKFFKDWGNFFSFAIALIPTILLYLFPPAYKVPFFAFIILLFLFILVLWLCIKLLLENKEKEIKNFIPVIECTNSLCLCKTNNFISYQSIVSFYQKSGNFEKLIGYGYVQTINSNNIAQIIVQKSVDESITDLLQYITDNRTQIVVKPTITLDTISQIVEIFNH